MLNFFRSKKQPEPAKSEFDAGPIDELAEFIKIREDGMAELMVDKLTAKYTICIPDCTLDRIGRLTEPQKSVLREHILISIAKCLHEFSFDPSRYLSTGYDTRNGFAR